MTETNRLWTKEKLSQKWVCMGFSETVISYGLEVCDSFIKNKNNIIHRLSFYSKKEEWCLDLPLAITHLCYRNKLIVRTPYETCVDFGLSEYDSKEFSKNILKNTLVIKKNLRISLEPISKFDFLERFLEKLKINSKYNYDMCFEVLSKSGISELTPNYHILTLAVIYYCLNDSGDVNYDSLCRITNSGRSSIRKIVQLIKKRMDGKDEL